MILSPEEGAAIPSQDKTRRIHVVDNELTPSVVMEKHERRSVAMCNTVGRAQALFEGLRRLVGPGTDVWLLHSRFLQEHREASEEWLRREFSGDEDEHTVESAILVATQVVEVGLDITSQALPDCAAVTAEVAEVLERLFGG